MNEIMCDCDAVDLGIQECEGGELVSLSYKYAAQAMRGVMTKIDVSDAQTLADRISEAILQFPRKVGLSK